MRRTRKALVCTFLIGFVFFVGKARADEPVTETVAIKMVLKNNQVKFVRQADGEVVSVKLTEAQKKLIRLNAPTFKGQTIRLSTEHLKRGTNKITVMILKPSSSTPMLRIIPPSEAG